MNSALNSLEGKVALVTGSTRGLGRTIAHALAHAGANVALNYHSDTEGAEESFQAFRATGARGALFCADITDKASIDRLLSDINAELGPVDILVVNATPDQAQRSIEDYTWSEVQRLLDAFAKSPFLLTQGVVGHMKAQAWGRIINIGSEVLDHGTPHFSAYVAAKGAQNGLNRSLAKELAPWKITVNMVSPGWIPVERHKGVQEEEKESYLSSVPMQRFGTPEDIGSAVTFLASEEARFISGANLHVNGARSVQ